MGMVHSSLCCGKTKDQNPSFVKGFRHFGEEIQEDFTGNEVPEEERSLHLKFLDEVSDPVLTSREFKGMKDGPLKVALFDATGNPVTSGPESSAEVEIVLSDASGNDTTNEDFERKLIRTGEKGKPHFAKNVYVKLVKGEGVLSNLKLGQGKDWTKTLTCRLGARFVDNIRGLKVQNAWTGPFEVKDNRGKLYEKHEPPFLTSEVWRLKEICRDGKPCRRLRAAKIETVQDLLFWLSVDPKRLKEILGAGEKRWNIVVEHARTCIIDDKRMYYHKSSTEPLMVVIYDSVGKLRGVLIDEPLFVPIDNLSAEEKDHADKLLLSLVLEPDAFDKRYQTFFNDEASLLQQNPYKSSTNCTIQQCWNPIDPSCSSQLTILDPENIDGGINPSNTNDSADKRYTVVEQQQALASGFHQDNASIQQMPGCSMDLNAQVISEIESNAIKKRKVEASLLQQINPYKSSIQQFDPGCSSQFINHNNHAGLWDATLYETGPIPVPENINKNIEWKIGDSPNAHLFDPGSEYTGDIFMATP